MDTRTLVAPARCAHEPRGGAGAVAIAAALSLAVLCVGGEAVGRLAQSQDGRSLVIEGSIGPDGQPDYGRVFDYAVAPLRGDVAASIQRIVIDTRDSVPLPWGRGYF